ncbi:MAG: PKD domain-containing protein [Candidatus Bathyarchaeota archaeon]|nr:PKD domain-containing protein [Candidatus Bathyarchaeota archaeon]
MRKKTGLLIAVFLMLSLVTAISPQFAKASDTYFYDDFSDGNSDGWARNLGNWQVIDREYSVSVGIIENGITTVTDMPLTDCTIETKLNFTDTVGFRAGIIFRYTDNENYYSFELSNEYDSVAIVKYTPQDPGYGTPVAGLNTGTVADGAPGTFPIQQNQNYTLKVVVQGSVFRCFVNDQEVMSGTDISYSSGLAGLRARRADVGFDYFKVENTTNLPLPPATQNPTPKPDLMAWWKMNEGTGVVAIDSSGNNHHGVIQGATWGSDQTGNSLSFDGISNYVSLPSLPLTTVDSFTVAAWINTNVTQVGYVYEQGNMGEFELANGELTNGHAPALNINFARFGVHLSNFQWYNVYSSSPMEPNLWHQLLGVWVKGTSLKVYVDGVLMGEEKVIPDLNLYNPGSGWPPSLGIYAQGRWGIPVYFKGQMRNVMVYDKGLTTQEIENLYLQFSEPVSIFDWSPSSSAVGRPILFNASLSQPNIGVNQPATITAYKWDFGDGNTTTTNQPAIPHTYAVQGMYNVTLTVYDNAGKNSSSTQTVQVKMSTSVSISTAASTVVGSPVSISGELADIYGTKLSKETVVLSYTFAGFDSWLPISSSATNENGVYYIQWVNTATGTFTLKAEWQGNATFVGTNSTVTLSSVPCQNQYVFLVESNSTISSLAFDSTSSQLGFTASGPSGTFGYFKVAIAKNLTDNVGYATVYLDGNQVPYSASSIADSWLLTLNYTHSSHVIKINIPISNIAQQYAPSPSPATIQQPTSSPEQPSTQPTTQPSASPFPTCTAEPPNQDKQLQQITLWVAIAAVAAVSVALNAVLLRKQR